MPRPEDDMAVTSIADSTRTYEHWLRTQLGNDLVEPDLRIKHQKMSEAPFPFLRATYWRWAETILDVCPKLANAPAILAVGDLHLENFGTWRDADGRLVWGVNDFDEAAVMPYPLDLVRLGVSALLGRPGTDCRNVCTQILAGYAEGLADPKPIILDRDFAWLRELVVVSEAKRKSFWQKIATLPPTRNPPQKRYVAALRDAFPEHNVDIRYHRRIAGAGSLGRPRWVAVGVWRGDEVVREAKAVVPSAWTLAHRRASQKARCYDIATGRYRAPDPWYHLAGDVVVRRLSPNNRKIEASEQTTPLASGKMLRVMARDLAAIHLGETDHRAAILHDLHARKRRWLESAVEAAAAFVRRDHKNWLRGSKKQKSKLAKSKNAKGKGKHAKGKGKNAKVKKVKNKSKGKGPKHKAR
jgi:hypothetical protein